MADCVLVRSPALRVAKREGVAAARETVGRREKRRARNKNVKRDSPRASSGVREDAVRMCVYVCVCESVPALPVHAVMWTQDILSRSFFLSFFRFFLSLSLSPSYVRVNKSAHRHRYLHMYTRPDAFSRGFHISGLVPASPGSPAGVFLLAVPQLLKRFIGQGLPVTRGNATGIRGYRASESFYGRKKSPTCSSASLFPLRPRLALV